MPRSVLLLLSLGLCGLLAGCGGESSPTASMSGAAAAGLPDVALLPGGDPGTPAAKKFMTHLTGAEEVPPVDTRGQGQALFTFSGDGTELHYKVLVANVRDITASHIHMAPAGQNGPVVVLLYGGGDTQGAILAEGVITAADLNGVADLDALRTLMLEGGAYVNVHTTAYPAGEIRGQVRVAGPAAP